MNPFELNGPEFLLFYLLLAGAIIGALLILRRVWESGEVAKMDLADAYLIAYLRGGKNEALRVAVVSLVDRGLLIAEGATLVSNEHATPDSVRRPIDKRLLEMFAKKGKAASAFDDFKLNAACEDLRATLKSENLLPGPSTMKVRTTLFLAALMALWGIGGYKFLVAIGRGRHNVGFLIALMLVSGLAAAVAAFPKRTVKGSAVLADLRTLYSDLKARAPAIRPGGSTIEAVMLAAVFGLAALPVTEYGFARKLYPRAAASSATSSCSTFIGCGTSCGASSSSSGGSSCGGGGCGGGCGGCGG